MCSARLVKKKHLVVLECCTWQNIYWNKFYGGKKGEITILQYFDANCDATLSGDASQSGFEVVNWQNILPIVCASRALTDTQKNYAQIEEKRKKNFSYSTWLRKISVLIWKIIYSRKLLQPLKLFSKNL